MGSVLGNIFNPLGNLIKGDARSVADPLKAFGDPNAPKDPSKDPEVPDYNASYQAGLKAETDALAQRRLIDAAAQLGGVFYNGQVISQDEFQQKIAFEQQKLAAAQASGNQQAINEANTELANLQGSGALNFKGAGSAELAQQQLLQEIQGADQTTRAQLDLEKKYGPEAAQLARDNIRAVDPTGFDLREQTGQNYASGNNSVESLFRGINAPSYESMSDSRLPQYSSLNASDAPNLRMLDENSLPNLQGVNGVNLADRGATAAGRSDLERQIFDELSQTGNSDPALQRAAEQAARARGAASGNILGDSSALQESLAVQLAQRGLDDKRRSDALNLLSSGQSTSDKNNELQQLQLQNDIAQRGFNNEAAQQGFNNRSSLVAANNSTAQQGFANKGTIAGFNNSVADSAFQNAMAAVNQRNQAAQNTFAGQSQAAQQQAGARQQDNANIQSFLGLQPVSAQAGGYQNFSAPFNPGNVQTGDQVDPNAGVNGAEWYSQLFGAQNQLAAGNAAAGAAKDAGNKQLIGAGAGVAAAAIIAI